MDMEIGFIYHSFYYQMLRFIYDIDKDTILYDSRNGMDPSKKIIFYHYVARHFFGEDAKVDYKAIDRDVPLKPFLNN